MKQEIEKKMNAMVESISNGSFYEPMMPSTFEYHLKKAMEFGYSLRSPDEKERINDLGEVFEVDEVWRRWRKDLDLSPEGVCDIFDWLVNNGYKLLQPLQEGEGKKVEESERGEKIYFHCKSEIDGHKRCEIWCDYCAYVYESSNKEG